MEANKAQSSLLLEATQKVEQAKRIGGNCTNPSIEEQDHVRWMTLKGRLDAAEQNLQKPT